MQRSLLQTIHREIVLVVEAGKLVLGFVSLVLVPGRAKVSAHHSVAPIVME